VIDRVLVAVEASGPRGSVAVSKDGEVRAQVEITGRTHARLLVPAVASVLEEAGLGRRQVEGIVVGAGPGSFTGVRIAAATAKGLRHALGCPLFAVSSLAAAACGDFAEAGPGLPSEACLRVVLFDARGDRVFAGGYEVGPKGVRVTREPGAFHLTDLLDEGLTEGADVVGNGAERHRRAIEARGYAVLEAPAGVPSARGLLYVLRHGGAAEPVADPGRWEPDYLRDSSAERERHGGG